jgi:inner membrane protein
MDPITHCLLGAVAAQAFFSRRLGRLAPVIGALAGGIADLDVLIRIPGDAIATMMYHRHFTHALLVIPLGGFLAALPFLWLKRLRYRRPAVIGAATLAYGLHGLLDATTSYGTLLFWPFSNQRIALDWMPIVDPIFLLILLAALIAGLIKVHPTMGRVGMILAVLYICIGAAQHERALNVQKYLADTRQHTFERSRVMPTLGNLVVWRSIYEVQGRVYADAQRIPFQGDPTFRRGESGRLFSDKQLPKTFAASRQERDLTAFRWFTDNWLAFVPDRQGFASPLLDMRYTYTPEGLIARWGIQLQVDQPVEPVELVVPHPPRDGLLGDLFNDIIRGESNGRAFEPLPYMPVLDDPMND